MTHESSHVIIQRIRDVIGRWPLSFVGASGAIGTAAGWWFL